MADKKTLVLVLVSRRYNPREFWPAIKILQESNISMDIVSTMRVIQNEENSKQAHKISRTVEDLRSAVHTDYRGAIVISGNPKDTEVYYKNKDVIRLITGLHLENKPLAGICAAVPSLAPAVRGRRVSWFPLTKSRNILNAAGAILTEVGLSIDGHIVTAENEWMTIPWAEAFRDLVLGKEPKQPNLTPSGLHPKRILRKPVSPLEAKTNIWPKTKPTSR